MAHTRLPRAIPVRPGRRLSADLAVMALAVGCILIADAAPANARILLMPVRRFTFKIDPKTPIAELVPAAPDVVTPTPPWLVSDLTQVPQIVFQRPVPLKKDLRPKPLTKEEEAQSLLRALEDEEKAQEATAHVLAKINHVNQQGTDHFMKVLLERRPDLTGLPIVMGNACRMSKERSLEFLRGVSMVQSALAPMNSAEPMLGPAPNSEAQRSMHFWDTYDSLRKPKEPPAGAAMDTALVQRERVAALTQMLAPHSAALRQGLVKYLRGLDRPEATQALARLAIFSFEREVRKHALAALEKRPAEEYHSILFAGMRHPWPAVVANAGDAIARLALKDLVPQLVDLLDEPDPRAPAETVTDGKKTLAVRELVRLNHHRNCLLCHPPANTPEVKFTNRGTTDVVTGAVPAEGRPFPSLGGGYDPGASPDIRVRADITYLRQDFSMLHTVKNAAPWPEMQRFDYLVRTRIVTPDEAAAYTTWLVEQGPSYLPPHRAAALAALRLLTSRDAAPTAQAWRAVLGQ